ncbi:DUF6285 domain-containing protein [Stutzerimonas tarimensis]|uniref:DUF6285 domain-containing protein n=1 Tax=Stutzerimonas tarimensis TaxID=1507735 RepID=A0ABV7T6J9_9GAMM
MRDQPTGEQLLATAEALLRERILPGLSGGQKTDALMIARAMAIAARQLRNGERPEQQELEALGGLVEDGSDGGAELRPRLLAANRALCQSIRVGEADQGERRAEIFAHLQRVTRQKLAESNPRLLDEAP